MVNAPATFGGTKVSLYTPGPPNTVLGLPARYHINHLAVNVAPFRTIEPLAFNMF